MRIHHSESLKADHEKEVRWLICFALAFITALVYGRAIGFEFVNYDDPLYVTNNAIVQKGLTWKGFVWAFTQVKAAANWHPLTWLSHMLDCQLFGMNPHGPHAVNVLLHTANSVLLFWLMFKLTGKTWRSAMIAALFALHPAHVESVAWISERKDVLSTFFGLGALLGYVDWARRPRKAAFWFALGLFALSLMAKGMLVTLPFLLLLLDYWPLHRIEHQGWRTFLGKPFWARIIEKWPWFLLTIIFSLITYFAQDTAGAVAPIKVQGYSLSFRIGNALTAYWAYVREMLWPSPLAVFYPLPPYRLILRVAAAALALLGVSAGLLLYSRRRPYLFIGWFWFVGTLVPVIGLVQVGSQSMADRYTYFPFIGLFVAIVWAAADALQRIRVGRQLAIAGAAVLVFVCSITTFSQLRYWQNSLALFSHDFAVVGDNALTLMSLADAYAQAGDEKQCIHFYRRAVSLDTNSPMSQGNLGRALVLTKNPAEALEPLEIAMKYDWTNAAYPLFYANALVKLGQPEAALAHFRRAILLNTNFAQAYSDMGSTLIELGRTEEGISNLQRAIQTETNFVEAYNNLGAAYMKQKNTDDALIMYYRALHIDPTNAVAHYNLGLAEDNLGRPDAALTNYQTAVTSDKKHADARYELGRHLFIFGDPLGAVRWLEESLKLKPDRAQTHLYLGLAEFQLGNETNAITHLRYAERSLTNSLEALNGLAWTLATATNSEVRNPQEAIRIAEKAMASAPRKQAVILRTMAAAYAADGRFEEALTTARSALELAQAQNAANLVTALQQEIERYEQRESLFRDSHGK